MLTIELQSIAASTPAEAVSRGEDGFIMLRPAEFRQAGSVRLLCNDPEALATVYSRHVLAGPVDPVGCHLLNDIRSVGLMYLFRNGALITDGTHLSKVTEDWIGHYPTHVPGAVRGRRPNRVDGIVLPLGAPGHQVYGHWVIDFLPRLALARVLFGALFHVIRVALLRDTPAWAIRIMTEHFGVSRKQIVWVQNFDQEYVFSRACVPSHSHSGDLLLHSFVKELYDSVPRIQRKPTRKLFIQRTERNRPFARRAEVERLAKELGFELINPVHFTFTEQAQMFSDATMVAGEYGSGLHNTVFGQTGCKVIALNAPGVEQTRISALFGHDLYLAPGHHIDERHDEWDLDEKSLARVFDLSSYTPMT